MGKNQKRGQMIDFASYAANDIKKLLGQNSGLGYLQELELNAWMQDSVANALSNILDKDIFDNTKGFDRDIHLKFELNKYLKNIAEPEKRIGIYEWIVQEWGGIKTHKAFDEVISLANKMDSFDRISSWSKIASIEDIEQYVIYDSRVIYALNWLLHKYNLEQKKQERYFLQPDGRNAKLSGLPITSLIQTFSEKDCFYKKKGDFYKIFCETIKKINDELFANDSEIKKYPFYTEMLLFQMADKKIFEDIKKTISEKLGW